MEHCIFLGFCERALVNSYERELKKRLLRQVRQIRADNMRDWCLIAAISAGSCARFVFASEWTGVSESMSHDRARIIAQDKKRSAVFSDLVIGIETAAIWGADRGD